jgi:hypothetical protein
MTFSLQQIKKTIDPNIPARTTIFAEHKQGKSTFASCAPKPIFVPTEDGLSAISVDAFPLCKSWDDVMGCISTLYQEKHEFKTAVIDSVDWGEALVQDKVAKDNGVSNIEKIGFGKGFLQAADLFSEMLDGLNALRIERGMNIVLLCHSQIRRFDDPLSDSYDRHELKLQKQIAKLVMEWSDVLGYACVDVVTKVQKEDGFKKERTRALSTGRRVLHLEKSAAFDAGNRFSLPAQIDFTWSAYEAALTEARKPASK